MKECVSVAVIFFLPSWSRNVSTFLESECVYPRYKVSASEFDVILTVHRR